MPNFYDQFAYYTEEDGAFYVNGYINDDEGITRRETLFDGLTEAQAQEICALLQRVVEIAGVQTQEPSGQP